MNPDDGDYNVPLSGAMRETVLRLQEQAYRKGYLYEFLTSFRTISDRLRGSPLAFGEEIYDLHHLHLTVRLAVVYPLAIEYAVHEEHRLVLIRSIRDIRD